MGTPGAVAQMGQTCCQRSVPHRRMSTLTVPQLRILTLVRHSPFAAGQVDVVAHAGFLQ